MSQWLRNLFLIFVLHLECRGEETVSQPERHQTELEGNSVTLNCKYSSASTAPDLFWYIQRANDILKYILRRDKFETGETDTEFQERFHSKLSSDSVPLTIQDVRVSDSAVYYCALRPTVRNLKSNHIQKHRSRNML
uniref:Ig-like domain-containing protein n=1 Tax=Cyprinus carpio TaxID=7962 RepID=A0A8C2EUF2_CYPCA